MQNEEDVKNEEAEATKGKSKAGGRGGNRGRGN